MTSRRIPSEMAAASSQREGLGTRFAIIKAVALLFGLGLTVCRCHISAAAEPATRPSCAVGWTSCAGTEGPSYQETHDWILQTVKSVAGSGGTDGFGGTGTLTYSDVTMDNCHFAFSFHMSYDSPHGNLDYSQQIDVPLAAVIRVRTGRSGDASKPGSVVIFVTATTAINHQGTTGFVKQGWRNWNTSDVSIVIGQPGVDTESYASRLQAAFVHASALCRAQAASHPSNEPF